MEPEPEERTEVLTPAQIQRSLGLFLSFFALVVLVSILFTETAVGKWTNLAAGLILGGIGGGMIARARARG